jgi:hypothetical protein
VLFALMGLAAWLIASGTQRIVGRHGLHNLKKEQG